MIGHKPECPANWGVGEMPEGPCTFCEMLSACEERVTELWESLRGWGESYAYKTGSDNGFDVGYTAGLDAAREAVAALPAPYKVRGDSNTYGPYNEGRSDFKDSALTAIDALRKEKP